VVLPRGNYRCDGGAKNTNLSIWLGWLAARLSRFSERLDHFSRIAGRCNITEVGCCLKKENAVSCAVL
jgi:hypothetical protein